MWPGYGREHVEGGMGLDVLLPLRANGIEQGHDTFLLRHKAPTPKRYPEKRCWINKGEVRHAYARGVLAIKSAGQNNSAKHRNAPCTTCEWSELNRRHPSGHPAGC